MRRVSDRSDWFQRYRWRVTGAAGVLVAVGLLIALWPASPPSGRALPPARARQYLAFRACLLTGSAGLADPAVAPVWAGMQDASLSTRAKVSYLAVAGKQTMGNAVPYANTLLAQRCDVVVAVGQSQVDAVNKTAAGQPSAKFVVVGGNSAAANVTAVPIGPADTERASVADLIKGLVH